MNGKGSKPRKNANHKAYWANYDTIFKKPKKSETETEK